MPAASLMSRDLERVLRALQATRGLAPSDIVLYGQSVGSGPTCQIAAGRAGRGLAGVVLHSPFLSGIRVLNPEWTWWPSWADVFPNYKAAPRIRGPTLIVHGDADDVIPIQHAHALQRLCPGAVPPLWVEGATHDDVELSPHFLPHLRRFLEETCWAQSPGAAQDY